MGFGFLTLPWAFVQGGVILLSIMMLVFFTLSDFAKDYILEGMARAEALVVSDSKGVVSITKAKEEGTTTTTPTATVSGESTNDDGHDRNSQVSEGINRDPIEYRMSSSLLSDVSEHDEQSQTIILASSSILVVKDRLFEVNELCQIFIKTPIAFHAFNLAMSFTILPKSDTLPSDDHFEPGFDGAVGCDLFHFPGLARTLPIIALTITLYLSIPGLAHDVSDKRRLGTIFRCTLVFCFVCYAAIAITVAWYFGDEVEKSANLNWMDYRGGTGEYVEESEEWVNVSWWAMGISGYVVCFPALL